MAFRDPKDELLRKFSKNVRKAMESRENLTPSRSVKFNPETMETSIGGTITSGRIRRNPNDSSILSLSSVSSNSSINSNLSANSASDKKVKPEVDNKNVLRRKSEQSSASPFKSKVPVTPVNQQKLLRRHTMDKMVPNPTPECFKPVSFETPAAVRGKHRRSSSLEKGGTDADEDTAITVAVRVRPFSTREVAEGDTKCIVSMIDNETIVTAENGTISRFTYDYSFWSFSRTGGEYAGQEYVYETLAQPMLGRVFEGYNVCLFAYGQTGSGKSYSITGHAEEIGVIPRFCEELFGRIHVTAEEQDVKINVEISFFEIYNEKIHDLLTPVSKDKLGKKPNLKVREHPLLGPFVEGLSSYVVKSFEDVEGWLSVGNKYRATAATGMNDKSSRSHSVFTLIVTQTRTDNIEGEDHEHSITSKINLVDLAGSERQSQAKTSGDRLREGSSINKSLLTLGKVISLLSEQANNSSKKKKIFIPYRDSVLTWMLKESLGGNSKTAMLATISPSSIHMEETISTLRYAKQARSIINVARVNEDPKARLIRELRAEIDKLRNVTGVDSDDVIGASLAEIANLRDKLSKKEKEMDEMTRSWQEKLQRSELRKIEEARSLEKSGISFQVDNRLPNLVNLNEDPQLSEMLLYILKEGQTKVGRMHEDSKHDIQLNGLLIAEDHCIINYVEDIVSIKPLGDAQTYVNGNLIATPTMLHHGDRVILGGDHYFRFNHPQEVQKAQRDRKSVGASQGPIRDFEFARQELIQVQNARHQAELDEAKQKHHAELQRTQSEAQRQMHAELERKRQEAERLLTEQRTQYEDKLSELERGLKTYKEQNQTTEEDWQKAQEMIQKLEKQKMMLEQEVNANRKRLEMEAIAAQQAVEASRGQHMQIFEMLEKEKEKIKKDVEQMRQRRTAMTPKVTPARTPLNDTALRDLYRIPLLLREANKISQFLKKDVFFMRHDVKNDNETETLVKITNNKMGICTFWTMEKFESRLVQMRELYNQGETDNGSEEDEVFNDTTDTWEREDRIRYTQNVTPQLIKCKNRRNSIVNTAKRLSFDSSSPSTPCANKRLKSESRTPTIAEDAVLSETSRSSNGASIPVVGICQDLISLAVDRFKGSAFEESIADKILCQCELLWTGVGNIVDSYKQAANLGTSKEYVQSHTLQVNAVQLTSSVQMLLTLSSLWSGSYARFTSGLVHDLCSKITACVRKLSNHLLLLLQGCENDVESLVMTYSSRFLEMLQVLTKHCGELSLATDTPMLVLRDAPESMASDGEEDEFCNPLARIKLSAELQRSFLSGCDLFVDKTLQGGVKTIEDCEIHLQDLHEQKPSDKLCTEVVHEVEVVTASCKILLQKCQQIQVELDNTSLEAEKKEPACDNFYERSYQRSSALIAHISNLADATSLLTQASQHFYKGQDESSLRKVHRCAEMIQKSTLKLLATSNTDAHAGSPHADSQSENSMEVSVLSDGQVEVLDIAGQDVRSATAALVTLLHKSVGEEKLFSPTKSKRLLPVSPENSNKANSHDPMRRRSISRTLSLIDGENKR